MGRIDAKTRLLAYGAKSTAGELMGQGFVLSYDEVDSIFKRFGLSQATAKTFLYQGPTLNTRTAEWMRAKGWNVRRNNGLLWVLSTCEDSATARRIHEERLPELKAVLDEILGPEVTDR